MDLSGTSHLEPGMPPDMQDYHTPTTSGTSTTTLVPQSPVSLSPLLQQSILSLPDRPTTSRNISFFFPTLERNTEESSPENARDEVERYSNEKVRLTDDFDVMLWWKNNSTKYPKLSKLAINLLSIPASSASSERVFSLAGNIITDKRNRLEPKTVDSIIFLNSIYKKKLW